MLSIEAENIVETTSAEFRRLVGLDQDVPFELAGRRSVRDARQSAAAWRSRRRLRRRRSTRRARTGPNANRCYFASLPPSERVAAASAGSLPVLTAIGGYDMARPNPRIFPIQEKWKPSWDIGVNVRWSLFDGGRVRAETAEAAANRRAVEARLRDFDAGHRGGSAPADGRARLCARVDRGGRSRRARRHGGAPGDRRAIRRRRRDQHRCAGRADRAAAGRARSSRARSRMPSWPARGSTRALGR